MISDTDRHKRKREGKERSRLVNRLTDRAGDGGLIRGNHTLYFPLNVFEDSFFLIISKIYLLVSIRCFYRQCSLLYLPVFPKSLCERTQQNLVVVWVSKTSIFSFASSIQATCSMQAIFPESAGNYSFFAFNN